MTFTQQWRRFNFFNKEVVEIDSPGRTYDTIRPNTFTCFSCGRGALVFGDENGSIHLMNHNYQVSSFRAYQISVSHVHQVLKHNVLVAVGIDEPGVNPVIRVWNMDKKEKNGNPFCTRIQPAIPNNIPTDVSALTVQENLTLMVVGFADGTVGLYKGDVLKDRHGNRSVFLQTGQSGPITGIHLHMMDKESYLFVTTHTSVLSFNQNEKNPRMVMLEDRGCPMLCSTISNDLFSNQLMIASNDAVYAYQPDARGSCFAFDGDKIMIRWYADYLVVVYKDKTRTSVSSIRPSVEKNMVTIYDMNQKLIAYSHALPSVKEVLYEWGSLYVVTANNALVCLQEKDIHSKLEMLFKKNHYSLAVNLAKNQDLGQEGLVEIFTQYGDHLYSKGDFDSAITQYIKTIKYLEPSYIIRKFLDAQRIYNLTEYLQALHKASEANKDHTTLLLNCFTKLKDGENLNKFIMNPDSNLQFDVETAIRVCRHAGFYEHALALAEKHHKHKWYLKIQLENTKDYEKALQYIRKLPFREAENNMKQYGRILLHAIPDQTTALLKDLCTDYQPLNAPMISDGEFDDARPATTRANGEEFIHIFINEPKMLINFLQHIIKVDSKSSEVVYNTLLELYFQEVSCTGNPKQRSQLEALAIDLIKDIASLDYDLDQALVLCQMHNFRTGILHLYEAAGLYQQILKYHMDHEAYGLVVETCRKHGPKDRSLWQHALVFLAHAEADCHEHIQQVLAHIEKHNLLPPLLVIQLLSRNSTVTLGVVKDYICNQLKQETKEIESHEQSIAQYREETDKMKEKIEKLQTSATIFQVTKCSLCSHTLELPSVHFLCQHSFHQHCFEGYSDNEQECPVCAGENRKIMEHIKEQEQILLNNRAVHEQFMSRLSHNKDGFSVIADYFAKGMFNKVAFLSDAELTQVTKDDLNVNRSQSFKKSAENILISSEHFSRKKQQQKSNEATKSALNHLQLKQETLTPSNMMQKQTQVLRKQQQSFVPAMQDRHKPPPQDKYKQPAYNFQKTKKESKPVQREHERSSVLDMIKSQMTTKTTQDQNKSTESAPKSKHVSSSETLNPFSEPANPFGSPQEDGNPFGAAEKDLNPFMHETSSPASNPFEEAASSNPFGDVEDGNPFE